MLDGSMEITATRLPCAVSALPRTWRRRGHSIVATAARGGLLCESVPYYSNTHPTTSRAPPKVLDLFRWQPMGLCALPVVRRELSSLRPACHLELLLRGPNSKPPIGLQPTPAPNVVARNLCSPPRHRFLPRRPKPTVREHRAGPRWYQPSPLYTRTRTETLRSNMVPSSALRPHIVPKGRGHLESFLPPHPSETHLDERGLARPWGTCDAQPHAQLGKRGGWCPGNVPRGVPCARALLPLRSSSRREHVIQQ